MRALRAAILALCAWPLAPSALPASPEPVLLSTLDAPPSASAPQVSLVTFAPGEVYWQRFGHNALLVRERGEARLYNYGIFDFHQENFFLNFARGRMLYRLDVAPLDWALRQYVAEGRWALEQRLALDEAQATALSVFLAWNARPENADYRYDYFFANCSTKTRDAIDRVLGGALRAQLEAQPGSGGSFRSEVLRLMAPMPPLMLGMDLGLGPRVDAPLDAWQEGFIPMRLMTALRTVRIVTDGIERPLIAGEYRLTPQPIDEAPALPAPSPWLPMLLTGLVVAALLIGLRRVRRNVVARVGGGLLSAVLALIFGLAGVVLALGWFGTEHWGMRDNRNLLLLSPLWLLLLPALLGGLRRVPHRSGAVSRVVAIVLALAAVLALLLSLFDVQPNLHWVLLLLPPQLVLLAPVMSRAEARDRFAG